MRIERTWCVFRSGGGTKLRNRQRDGATIAASAVLLALKTLGKEPWTSDLATHAGYSEAALMPCVREINRLHKAAGGAKLQAVRKKYSQEKHGCIATFNPINLDGALVVN